MNDTIGLILILILMNALWFTYLVFVLEKHLVQIKKKLGIEKEEE